MLKSRPDRYGSVAVTSHWLTAILIVVALGSGFQADQATDSSSQAGFLRVHIPVAITVLLLTLFRIVWWWRFDRKPMPVEGPPPWQERFARFVHVAFYIVILGMVASGIGMMVLSGAGPTIFGGSGVLPDFHDYPPRVPHGIGASLLVVLLVFHAGAALYHQFVLGDGLVRRMWYRR
ncbi:cytochrome b/b6 domain-containing protein [Bosea sp. (in: a-proteobacteria)]|uniref:cytochrome b n=1 Tax=Bosea sp. (in: a-proteobacteria) TaxID=1871050 RepID=UPI00260837B4|nr:cytochrome b/b6 domain-containing protein [Bosea sp. (in: a-proteobacteria)]MCO5089872.1 cytochrome b/b6 domain-containing protein [Bosea sp. (in: a-proteobacteria)]